MTLDRIQEYNPERRRCHQGEAQEQRGWTTLVSSPADINGEVGIGHLIRREASCTPTAISRPSADIASALEHEMASCEGV